MATFFVCPPVTSTFTTFFINFYLRSKLANINGLRKGPHLGFYVTFFPNLFCQNPVPCNIEETKRSASIENDHIFSTLSHFSSKYCMFALYIHYIIIFLPEKKNSKKELIFKKKVSVAEKVCSFLNLEPGGDFCRSRLVSYYFNRKSDENNETKE